MHNTKRLSTLTSNILLLSRLENQEIGIQKEHFCLDEQIREILLLLEDKWTEKKLELEIDLDAADYYGNKDLLAHVWQNILSNAIRFAPSYGLFFAKKQMLLVINILKSVLQITVLEWIKRLSNEYLKNFIRVTPHVLHRETDWDWHWQNGLSFYIMAALPFRAKKEKAQLLQSPCHCRCKQKV